MVTKSFLRQLAPYCLLLAPLLLWVLPGDRGSEGLMGQAVLEMALVYLGFGACALVMGKRHPGTAALLGGLLLLAFVNVEHDPLPGEQTLRVAHLHLADSTAPSEQIAADATTLELDFLSLADTGRARMDELSCVLGENFPYAYHCYDKQDSGVAVFSRYPLEELEVNWYADRAHISGKVSHPGGSIGFVAGGGPDSVRSTARMQAIAHRLQEHPGPKVVLDAFPALPTTEKIADFKRQSSLHDGRTAWTDVHPEWADLLADSVDYIFHSPEIRCLEFRTLDYKNLRGVVGTFSLPS